MAQRKVRHAIVTYTVEADGRKLTETAFRGQTIDIKDEAELERLEAFGAVVAEDEELTRPGRMLGLAEAASDEEIINWVLGATESEVKDLARQRPMLAQRVEAAQGIVKQRMEEQNKLLGQAVKAAKEGADEAAGDGGGADQTQTGLTTEPVQGESAMTGEVKAEGEKPKDEDKTKTTGRGRQSNS